MERLTGKYFHKKTWFGFVLMVEVERQVFCEHDMTFIFKYKTHRKAKRADIVNLKMR